MKVAQWIVTPLEPRQYRYRTPLNLKLGWAAKMSANNQLYFRLSLTENEHYIVNDMFYRKCNELGLNLMYYRKLKNGHIPSIREVKVVGEKLYRFQKYLEDEKFALCSKQDVEVQDKYGFDSKTRWDSYIAP